MGVKLSLAATFLLGLIPAPALSSAQEFSADVVYLTAGTPAASSGKQASVHDPSKLYVSKDKIRLETRGLTGTILLVSGPEHTTWVLFPAKKEYQPLASGPSEYFRVQDAENACPDWQKAADHGIVCEKVGHEVVDGRQAVKYRDKLVPGSETTAVWVDVVLKFVVKWEDAKAGAELRNIREGQQAADLFLVPSSYQQLKPQKGSAKGFAERKP